MPGTFPVILHESAAVMRDLHPAGPLPARATAPGPKTPTIDVATVDQCLRSFPKGTGAGPSGLRVQHIVDSLCLANKEAVLEQLAKTVEFLAAGQAPSEVSAYLAGANLVALKKKCGGLRPIAVGESLRRLVSKCLCAQARQAAQEILWPGQVGCPPSSPSPLLASLYLFISDLPYPRFSRF